MSTVKKIFFVFIYLKIFIGNKKFTVELEATIQVNEYQNICPAIKLIEGVSFFLPLNYL